MTDLNLKKTRKLLVRDAAGTASSWHIAARVGLVIAFVALTNFGFWQRVDLLVDTNRWSTLLPFLAIWAVALMALIAAALHPRTPVRLLWAAIIAFSTAAAWGYHRASQSDLGVFDILSLWNARHEAGRAAEFYTTPLALSVLVLIAGFIVFAVPSGLGRGGRWGRLMTRLALLPILPVALIGGVVYAKAGGGSQSLPAQFTPVALSTLAGAKIALQGTPQRAGVIWPKPKVPLARNIVLLVDQSIRADYLDLTPGNPHTPNLANLSGDFVDFGPAVSGGNCSNCSNAILRFAAARRDFAGSINSSPTLWHYAKRAGYRTVFIDAQAGNITNPGLMQNFMTMSERAAIDSFHAIRDVDSAAADRVLIRIVAEELAKGGPVFIYANKNGAHFPYDHAYPASAARYHPTMGEDGGNSQESRIASYRNAISWSVDLFMKELFDQANLADAALIYTSDHAQMLEPGRLAHCQMEDPDPRQGLVPLLVHAGDPALREALARGAALSSGKASHFLIAPAILEFMGYGAKDVMAAYDKSLLHGTERTPAFSSGDIFGLFGAEPRWTTVDPSHNYMEPIGARLLPATAPLLTGAAG